LEEEPDYHHASFGVRGNGAASMRTDVTLGGYAVEDRAMKAAIVSPHPAFPPDSGDRVRTATLVEALARRGVEARVFALDWEHRAGLRGPNARTGLRGPNAGTGLRGPNAGTGRRPAPAWEERIAVGPTTPHGRVAWRADLARRRRRDPYAIHHDRRAQAALLAAIDGFGPDVVDVQHTFTWFPQRHPAVVTVHNVESARHADGGARPAVIERLRRMERTAIGQAAATVVFSGTDRDRVAGLVPGAEPVVVPIGHEPSRAGHPLRPDLRVGALVGSFDYEPNRDAARALLERWPELRRTGPLDRLVIVGRAASAHLTGGDAVEIRSDVPDVAAALADTDVLLVPLRNGGGVRVKVIEALALGLPVVSTPVGVEGLGIEPGVHAVVADDVDGFADAVRAVAPLAVRRGLARAGRRLWEDTYSPDAMAAGMAEVYRRVQRPGRRPIESGERHG
jgi:glycosyltransferase involved in cell wall biosynthesis